MPGVRAGDTALGTMTFGTEPGWGARRERNFIDTANAYTNGTAEQIVREFARSRRDRHEVRDAAPPAAGTGT